MTPVIHERPSQMALADPTPGLIDTTPQASPTSSSVGAKAG